MLASHNSAWQLEIEIVLRLRASNYETKPPGFAQRLKKGSDSLGK
jgi:hypothetical protein